jgi:hypothetical protein
MSAILKVRENKKIKSYRVDLIFSIKKFLFLAESKGHSKESEDDIRKLRSIKEHLNLDGINQQLNRQGITVPDEITTLVLMIAVETIDSEIPADCVFLEISENSLSVRYGSQIPTSVISALTEIELYLRKKTK